METSVFGGVALCMPAWIRVKDKKNGAGEKTKNDSSPLLVRTSEQGVTLMLFVCDSAAFPDGCQRLSFSLFSFGSINEELTVGFVSH